MGVIFGAGGLFLVDGAATDNLEGVKGSRNSETAIYKRDGRHC